MHHLIKTFLLLTGVLFCGCLPDPLPVTNIPILPEKMVVSTVYVPDQAATVFLTRSFYALDAGPVTDFEEFLDTLLIDDALVTLDYHGQTDTLVNFGSGIYGAPDINPTPFGSYTLKANSPSTGLSVQSTTTLLPQVQFDRVVPVLEQTPFDTLITLQFALTDPPGDNWYMVNVQKFTLDLDQVLDISNRPFTYLLTDKEFQNQSFADTFRVFFYDFAPDDTVLVSLSNVSEAYYEFLDLRLADRYQLLDELAEPINYPSNVENGYGYFNLYTPDIRLFDLDPFIELNFDEINQE